MVESHGLRGVTAVGQLAPIATSRIADWEKPPWTRGNTYAQESSFSAPCACLTIVCRADISDFRGEYRSGCSTGWREESGGVKIREAVLARTVNLASNGQ